jgi:hypothetical protein
MMSGLPDNGHCPTPARFVTLAIREYLVARGIGKLSLTRHSTSLACGRLRRHSATAKQCCSSSSTVAPFRCRTGHAKTRRFCA